MAEIEQLQEMLVLLKKQMGVLEQQVQAASERLANAKAQAAVVEPEKKSRKGIGGRKPLHVKCGIPNCDNPHQARGLCSVHYAQFRRAAERAGEPFSPDSER